MLLKGNVTQSLMHLYTPCLFNSVVCSDFSDDTADSCKYAGDAGPNVCCQWGGGQTGPGGNTGGGPLTPTCLYNYLGNKDVGPQACDKSCINYNVRQTRPGEVGTTGYFATDSGWVRCNCLGDNTQCQPPSQTTGDDGGGGPECVADQVKSCNEQYTPSETDLDWVACLCAMDTSQCAPEVVNDIAKSLVSQCTHTAVLHPVTAGDGGEGCCIK